MLVYLNILQHILTHAKLQIPRVYAGIRNTNGFAVNGAKTWQLLRVTLGVTLSILINVGGIQQ